MTAENLSIDATAAPTRRTVLKAGAWSVPVIAAAVAAPLAAASTAIDLRLEDLPFGDGFGAESPDGLRRWSITMPSAFRITNDSAAAAPVGTVITVASDVRVMSDPAITVGFEGLDVPRAGVQTDGNVVTATFTLPTEIPAGGSVEIWPSFGVITPDWYEDVNPFVVSVVVAGDPTPENNVMTMPAWYVDTNDGVASAVWSTASVANEHDPALPYVIDVPTSITLTSLTPGGTSDSMSFSVRGPQVAVSRGEESVWEDAFTGATIDSALLDGVDVSSDVVAEQPLSYWLRNTPISAGQSLVVNLTVALHAGPVHGVSPFSNASMYNAGASVQVSISSDRDLTNDVVRSPNYPV